MLKRLLSPLPMTRLQFLLFYMIAAFAGIVIGHFGLRHPWWNALALDGPLFVILVTHAPAERKE